MPQSLSAVYVHLVFSTKDRVPYLEDPGKRDEAHRFLAGVSRELDCPTILVGGIADHVHILARLARTICQSDYVKEMKRPSSIWAKKVCDPEFSWQAGYGIFSASGSDLDDLEMYIRNQEEHHKKLDFKTEFRALLNENRVQWDEKYVWD